MADDPQGRFEFRIWADRLPRIRVRLAAIAAPGHVRQSAETYILSRATDAANVKIRCGSIDIKLLIERDGALERWRPVMKAPFPLPGGVILNEVFAYLGVPAPPIDDELNGESWPMNRFFTELIEPHPDLAAVDLMKTRHHFTIAGCMVEFTEVKIASGPWCESLGLESEDPQALRGLIEQFGLSAHPNVSYVRHLKSILGMAPRAIALAR